MNFIQNESAQKLRGGYYTPPDLAQFIARWVLSAKPASILEPSCGDGVFFDAIGKIAGRTSSTLVGFELEAKEATKARAVASNVSTASTVHAEDFLQWAITALTSDAVKFDGVVGNPPFVRYQYLSEEAQARSELIFRMLRLPFTKHTNAWVPFVLASIALLKPGGRLGMIIPSEIVHVMHAQSLRSFLGQECSRLMLIDPEEIWFEGTLQGAVILFAEKKRRPEEHGHGLGMLSVRGRAFLTQDPEALFDGVPRINGKTVEGKWTRALLTPTERGCIDSLIAHPDVHRFRDVADVNVGIVTGANKFFLVNDAVVEEFELQKFAHPMFGRSEHVDGVIYDEEQHRTNAFKGNPTNFIWIPADATLNKKAREYIRLGEEQQLHTRYKCRIRKPWYTVPSVHATSVGMLKRSHDTPRLILNTVGAYTTDTAYRIRASAAVADQLVYCFLNSLTAVSAELEGRHYGGGVLELVPSEIEKMLIPLPKELKAQTGDLDVMVREKPMEAVLQAQDDKVLAGLGIGPADRTMLNSAWLKLKNRRQRVSTESEATV